jgi:acyl carrier protein
MMLSSPAATTASRMIRERLRNLLAREEAFHFTPDLPDDASLIDAGVLDSFALIALVIQIEEEFRFKVAPEEATADRFQSVTTIAAYIETKLHGNHRR